MQKWGFGNNYAKKYWHQGYASEALDTVLEHINRYVNYIKYEQALSDVGLRSLVTYY